MNNNQTPALRRNGVVVVAFALTVMLSSCKQDSVGGNPSLVTPDNPTPVSTTIPKHLDPVVDPADNPSTPAKVELGRHLFFDKALSVDGSTSCGSCHQVSHGFSDILQFSIGMEGQRGNRNAPSLANIAYSTAFTWDGRFKSLEEHAPGPIFNSLEMGNNFTTDPKAQDSVPNGYNSKPGPSDTNFLFKRLFQPDHIDMKGVNYNTLFVAAWGSSEKGPNGISMEHIAKSIAAFEHTFISTQSRFDKYNNGDVSVYKYNPEALHGLQLFTDANGANCVSCHSGYNFTDQKFHDNGIGTTYQSSDKGRSQVTKNSADDYMFKTPSLRNVALSAPYMHDGRFTTLDAVLKNYNAGGMHSTPHQDSKIKPLNLSDQDMVDIIEFLNTLTDDTFTGDQAGKYTNPWGR